MWSVEQRWGPLCEFLELPVPDARFPRVSDRTEFLNRIVDGSLEALREWRERQSSGEPSFAISG